MENKGKFWKGVLVGAMVTAFAGLMIVGVSTGILLVGRTMMNDQADTSVVETEKSQKLNVSEVDQKVNLIQQVIDKYFLFDEDTDKVKEGIYMGMLYGLEDPYSVYYTKEEYDSLVESTNGVYCGIGVMISQNRTTGVTTVIKVFPDQPGYEAGILPGDIIYQVSGVEVTGMDSDILVNNYIKGEEGTKVDITVFRTDTNEYVDMQVERRQIEVPTVESKMMEDGIGYVQVSQFDVVTADQFKSAIDSLQSQGMTRMIVDLRGNPGGVLDSVVSMLDYILPDGILVYTKDKNDNGDEYYSKDGHEVKLPMVVLVDGNSASASEVFSGAVKDYHWATLVGTKTFGKGIVQNLIPLGDGTAVKLTVSHYFTPSGFDLHGKGIEPDVEVELNEELKSKAVITPEEDNQLQEAIRVVKEIVE